MFEIYLGPPGDRYKRRLSVLSGYGRLHEADDGTCIELRLVLSQWPTVLMFLGTVTSLVALAGPAVGRWLGLTEATFSGGWEPSVFVGPLIIVGILANIVWELLDDAYRDFVVRGLRAREVEACPAANEEEQAPAIP